VQLTRPSAPRIVLGLLCALYFILYIDRVNIAVAAPLIKADLRLSNTQLGLVFSAFAIPYTLFQLIGGWIGDRFVLLFVPFARSHGARCMDGGSTAHGPTLYS
jgi:MFS family permease